MAKTIKKNESFRCQSCYQFVPMSEKSCRNHCCFCLWSLHVDGDVPGDRNSECGGLMEPIKIDKLKKGFTIHHKCQKCKKIKNNIVSSDDNWDKIIEFTQPI